jgi:hypothetical protein
MLKKSIDTLIQAIIATATIHYAITPQAIDYASRRRHSHCADIIEGHFHCMIIVSYLACRYAIATSRIRQYYAIELTASWPFTPTAAD